MLVNKTISQQKLQVFFRRVSTENQSLEMQYEADKKYRDQLDDDEYIEVNELAVSANKVKLKDREKLLEVTRLIENGEVSTVYVYDRSRLARNFYEYLQLVDLFITHDVEVVFTTTDTSYSAFTSNYLVEGFNGILIEEEGKAIARRVAESHRKLPSKKFGFDTNKSDDGKKSYTVQLQYKEPILRLFETASEVSSATSFIELLSHFSRVLKKQPTDILRMLTDSFYTGHEQIVSRFSKLTYVEPLLSLELYKAVQVAIKPFIERLQNNLVERSGENVLHPYCDICKRKMVYRKSQVGESGKYTCSNKHQKIEISSDIFNEVLVNCVKSALANLQEVEIEKTASKLLNTILLKLEVELQSLHKKIEKSEMKIATLPSEYFLNHQYKAEVTVLKNLKRRRKDVKEQLLHCENHKIRVIDLVTKVKVLEHLKEEALLNIVKFIVKDSFVNETTISFNFYFSEYLNKESLERMVVCE